jgi:DNA-binding NarL/FixJ family response regulator
MRIVIAEDEALLREGLAMVLERQGFEVAAAVGTATELVDHCLADPPDLVITDIRMPPTFTNEGLKAAIDIRKRQPSLAVIVLSQYVQRQPAIDLLQRPTAGTGYLLKQRITDAETFCADVRAVHDGGTILDPEVAELMMTRARNNLQSLDGLTTRQLEVLAMMAQGRSNAWIAHSMAVSEKAVVQHVSHIYDQLGLPPDGDDHRRVLAVIRYLAR